MQYKPEYSRETLSFLDFVWKYKGSLALYIVLVSLTTFIGLYLIGGVPNELRVATGAATTTTSAGTTTEGRIQGASTSGTQAIARTPTHIYIDSVGISSPILNPTSTHNDVLNAELLKGAVRYPGSALLGEGNVFIFGHNTGLKVVNNPAYKAFNGLRTVHAGDIVRVRSATKEFTYSVISITLENSDEAFVDLSSKKNMLTLATCNVFGEKQERYIVQAVYVSSRDL